MPIYPYPYLEVENPYVLLVMEKRMRPIAKDRLDYDMALEFLRKTAPRAYFVFLDKKFFPGLKAKAKELVTRGDMEKVEYNRIFIGSTVSGKYIPALLKHAGHEPPRRSRGPGLG